MTVTAAEGALDIVEATGRSAHLVGREIATVHRVDTATRIRSFTFANHSVLAAPLAAASGAAGLVAVGVRLPDKLGRDARQRLREIAPLASIALQLAKPRVALTDIAIDGEPHLSRRERDVIALLVAGKSVKEASATLGLSHRTVETYLERLKHRHRQPRLHALLAHLVKTRLA